MKTKFKFFALLVTVCMAICATFAGCLSTADYEEIYNDDSKIANGSAYALKNYEETAVKGSYKLNCSSLSGVYNAISSFEVSGSTSANLSFDLTGGKGKVVLVKGNSVYTLTDKSFDGAVDFSNIPEGKYNFKIVGVEAGFTLSLEY